MFVAASNATCCKCAAIQRDSILCKEPHSHQGVKRRSDRPRPLLFKKKNVSEVSFKNIWYYNNNNDNLYTQTCTASVTDSLIDSAIDSLDHLLAESVELCHKDLHTPSAELADES